MASSQRVSASPLRQDLTVVILAFNEQLHISRAISSVRELASEIVVVDSFSTDDTVLISQSNGARVLQHPFVNQAKQFNWALKNANVKTAWTMRIDADEIISPELACELKAILSRVGSDVAGVALNRRHIFLGRWIKWGGRYPLRLIRLWRTGQGCVEDRWMDEHVVVTGGRIINASQPFYDDNLNDLTFFVAKHNGYATREALERLNISHDLLLGDQEHGSQQLPAQARAKRFMKNIFYNNLPAGLGPLLYFLYRYFLQLGFLDGRQGAIYHFLQGYWYRFLVESRLFELERGIIGCNTREEKIEALSKLTGYDVGVKA